MGKSVVRWYGGKGLLQNKIIPLMPPCTTYVEPFGGAASVLLAREPSDLDVYNDLHDGLYSLFMVLSDPCKFEQFYRRVQPILFSQQHYDECRDTWKSEQDSIMKAVKFYVAAKQAFSGVLGSGWGRDGLRSHSKNVMAWMNSVDGLPEVHHRLRCVQIHHLDWIEVVDLYDSDETLFYCDPPYVHDTRVDSKVYEHEMTADDHRKFIDKMLSIKGMVVISGYTHPIYEPLEGSGWHRYDFEVSCNPSRTIDAERNKRVETVWVKPFKVTKTKQKTFG